MSSHQAVGRHCRRARIAAPHRQSLPPHPRRLSCPGIRYFRTPSSSPHPCRMLPNYPIGCSCPVPSAHPILRFPSGRRTHPPRIPLPPRRSRNRQTHRMCRTRRTGTGTGTGTASIRLPQRLLALIPFRKQPHRRRPPPLIRLLSRQSIPPQSPPQLPSLLLRRRLRRRRRRALP